MRILVTGATGFLGGAVARRLRASGADVRATGRDPAKGAALAALGLAFEPLDLGSATPGEVASLVAGCDCVVHCAALSAPWGPREAFVSANVEATRRLVEAMLAAGVPRLVHISTPSLYMGAGSRLDVREDDPLPPPVNLYAATKRDAERIVEAARPSGLRSILLRPRAIIGPGDTTIFPRIVGALRARRLPLIGDGRNVVDLTYIDNAVHAVERACDAPAPAWDRTYNITNGEPVQLWPVIFEVADALGLPRPVRRLPRAVALALAALSEAAARVRRQGGEPTLTRYGVQVLADSMTLNIARARQLLSYTPPVSQRQGIRRLIDALRPAS